MSNKFEPFVDNFWEHALKLPDNGCWEWQGCLSHGYGNLRFRGRTTRAHRISWILANGEIPEDKCVLHHCDNKKCVRPSHLYIGTFKDNANDRERRHRGVHYRGEQHGRAKLDKSAVARIRSLRAMGLTYATILKQFPLVSISTVAFVCQGRTWNL